MFYSTLISTDQAYQYLNESQWLFIDCRYYLDKPKQGRQEFSQSHLPGALYAHLDRDLSSAVVPGVTGRHPLPGVDTLCQLFSSWGVDQGVQVVVYDQGPGMIAARLWWMLRWLGHDRVAVMEGGWKKWCEEAKPVTKDLLLTTPRQFIPNVHPEMVASVDDVVASISHADIKLLDARTADRYRGENETLDPVAGHIPGAISAPFMDLVGSDGCLRSPDELSERYHAFLSTSQASDAIVYCGSGVTAALNILAMEHVGLGMARLYPGSWSHWITDKNRPVATGE
ncbi:MAG: 3-mercaptopyruvate sulfurtransferase [Gammaproteobacteria bacterium SG8_11]|nr:MAG: 3-mercaptopyruvate sulfurtransferase [Gammaproteobacteria bacterium SG8_11]